MSSANLSIILIFLSLVDTTDIETGFRCLAVQKKLHIGVLRLLSLAGIWELGFQKGSHASLTDEGS